METLITLFAVLGAIGLGIGIWLNTKSGKKWLKDL